MPHHLPVPGAHFGDGNSAQKIELAEEQTSAVTDVWISVPPSQFYARKRLPWSSYFYEGPWGVTATGAFLSGIIALLVLIQACFVITLLTQDYTYSLVLLPLHVITIGLHVYWHNRACRDNIVYANVIAIIAYVLLEVAVTLIVLSMP